MTVEIILPFSIEDTLESIQQYQKSGINNPVHVMLMGRHILFLETYCKRRKELEDKIENAKNSYQKAKYKASLEEIDKLIEQYGTIFNDLPDNYSWRMRSFPCNGYE